MLLWKNQSGNTQLWKLDSIIYLMVRNLSKLREIIMKDRGALVCCSPWGRKGTTERLNNSQEQGVTWMAKMQGKVKRALEEAQMKLCGQGKATIMDPGS